MTEIENLKGEIERLRSALETAAIQISGGLCYFTAEAKQAQLRDAAKTIEEALAARALDTVTEP